MSPLYVDLQRALEDLRDFIALHNGDAPSEVYGALGVIQRAIVELERQAKSSGEICLWCTKPLLSSDKFGWGPGAQKMHVACVEDAFK